MFDVAKTFDGIYGFKKYGSKSQNTKSWLSHCPIHESEMRSCNFNVHGHIHDEASNEEIKNNPKYVNVNVDVLWPKYNKVVINWQELMKDAKSSLIIEESKG